MSEPTNSAAIIAAILTGTFSGYIGAYISYLVAKKNRKHELKIIKIETTKANNAEIINMVSDIKVLLTQVKAYSIDYAYSKLYYYKAFYSNQIRFKEQEDDSEKLALATSDSDKAILKTKISNREGKIEREAQKVNNLNDRNDEYVKQLNEVRFDLVKKFNALSKVSTVSTSHLEVHLDEYYDPDFNFIPWRDIRLMIKAVDKIDDLNEFTLPNELMPTSFIEKEFKRCIEPIKQFINETEFLIK